MNKEQLDQAAIEAFHSGNIKRNIRDWYCTLAAEEAFKKGAQWMEKQHSKSAIDWRSLEFGLPTIGDIPNQSDDVLVAYIYPEGHPPDITTAWYSFTDKKWVFCQDIPKEARIIGWCPINYPPHITNLP